MYYLCTCECFACCTECPCRP